MSYSGRLPNNIRPRVKGAGIDMSILKDKLRDEMGEFLYIKTELRPMVIPVIIEV